MRPSKSASRGVTLVEALIVVFIIAILTAAAGPAFTGMIAAQRAKSAASELHAALLKTRSEAVKRNALVQLRPASDAGSWAAGWRVVAANDPSTVLEHGGAVSNLTVTGPVSFVTFAPSGRLLTSQEVQFVVQAPGAQASAQCITLGAAGRPFMKGGTAC